MNPPSGCRFHTRCWKMQEICREVEPPLEAKEPRHFAACHFPLSRGEVEKIIETPDQQEEVPAS